MSITNNVKEEMELLVLSKEMKLRLLYTGYDRY